jgi:hypothetical protein
MYSAKIAVPPGQYNKNIIVFEKIVILSALYVILIDPILGISGLSLVSSSTASIVGGIC